MKYTKEEAEKRYPRVIVAFIIIISGISILVKVPYWRLFLILLVCGMVWYILLLLFYAARYTYQSIKGLRRWKFEDMAKLELKVAEILARQYHLGTQAPDRVAKMRWDEYWAASRHNWLDAGRGVISLISVCLNLKRWL